MCPTLDSPCLSPAPIRDNNGPNGQPGQGQEEPSTLIPISSGKRRSWGRDRGEMTGSRKQKPSTMHYATLGTFVKVGRVVRQLSYHDSPVGPPRSLKGHHSDTDGNRSRWHTSPISPLVDVKIYPYQELRSRVSSLFSQVPTNLFKPVKGNWSTPSRTFQTPHRRQLSIRSYHVPPRHEIS